MGVFPIFDQNQNQYLVSDLIYASSGLADFENTVDCGSAVNFGADSGLCHS